MLLLSLTLLAATVPLILGAPGDGGIRRRTGDDQVRDKDLYLAANSTSSIASLQVFNQLPSKDKPVATVIVPTSKSPETLSLPDKGKPDPRATALSGNGMSTPSITKDDQTTSLPAKEKSFPTTLVLKDDKPTSSLIFEGDKTSSLATSLLSKNVKATTSFTVQMEKISSKEAKTPSKDDRTSDLPSLSSDKKIPFVSTVAGNENDKPSSSTAILGDETSSAQGKDKDLASSPAAESSNKPGTDKDILSVLSTNFSKSNNLSANDKTVGPPEIVYSVTVPLTVLDASAGGKSSLLSFSLPTRILNSAVTQKATETAYLGNPSPMVIPFDSVSKTEFPGYQIVPSPTQAPSKGIQLVTGSVTPVYTPAMLGNAYGGGFIITPSIYVSKRPFPSGPSEGVPPGYGSYSKLEFSLNDSVPFSSFAVGKDEFPVANASPLTQLPTDKMFSLAKTTINSSQLVSLSIESQTSNISFTLKKAESFGHLPVTTGFYSGRVLTNATNTIAEAKIGLPVPGPGSSFGSHNAESAVYYVTKEVIVTTTYCPISTVSGKTITLSSTTFTKTFSTVSLVAVTQAITPPTAQSSGFSTFRLLSSLPAKDSNSVGPHVPPSAAPFTDSTVIIALNTKQSLGLQTQSGTVLPLSGLYKVDQGFRNSSLNTRYESATEGFNLPSVSVERVTGTSKARSAVLPALTVSVSKSEVNLGGGITSGNEIGGLKSATPNQTNPELIKSTATIAREIKMAASAATASSLPRLFSSYGASAANTPTGATTVASPVSETPAPLGSELSLSASQPTNDINVVSLISELSALLSSSSPLPGLDGSEFPPLVPTASIVEYGNTLKSLSGAPNQITELLSTKSIAPDKAAVMTVLVNPTGAFTKVASQPLVTQIESAIGSVPAATLSQGAIVGAVAAEASSAETGPSAFQTILSVGNSEANTLAQLHASRRSQSSTVSRPFTTSASYSTLAGRNATFPATISLLEVKTDTPVMLQALTLPQSASVAAKETRLIGAAKNEAVSQFPVGNSITTQATAPSLAPEHVAVSNSAGGVPYIVLAEGLSGGSDSAVVQASAVATSGTVLPSLLVATTQTIDVQNLAVNASGSLLSPTLIGTPQSSETQQAAVGASRTDSTANSAGTPETLGLQRSAVEASHVHQLVTFSRTPATFDVPTSATAALGIAQASISIEAGRFIAAPETALGVSETAQEASSSASPAPVTAPNKHAESIAGAPTTLAKDAFPVGTASPSGEAKEAETLLLQSGHLSGPSVVPSLRPSEGAGPLISPHTTVSTTDKSGPLGDFKVSGASNIQAEPLSRLSPASSPGASEGAGVSISPISSLPAPTTPVGVPKGAIIPATATGARRSTVNVESSASPFLLATTQASLSTGRATNSQGGGNDSVSIILSPTTILPFLGAGDRLATSCSLGLTALVTLFLVVG